MTTLLLPCLHVQAQVVRKCQIEGRLVYQSSPCPIEARPVTAQASAPIVSAAMSASGPATKKTLAELLRDRDALDPSPSIALEAQGDGANVLRSRMGAR